MLKNIQCRRMDEILSHPEQGGSDELLKKNGIYARMVKLQTQSQNWAME